MGQVESREKIVAGTIQKVAFASDQLPAHLDDRARFLRWREQWNALYGSVEVTRADDRPFSVRFEFAPIGSVGVGRFEGTISHIARSARDVAADNADNFCLGLPHGRFGIASIQNGREVTWGRDTAVLLTNAEPGEILGRPEIGWYAINVSRRQLIDLVADAEDLIGAPLDPESEALRHLRRYLGILLGPDGIGRDPELIAHVGATLLDLVALTLGSGRDTSEVVRMRGLRAARLQELLARIKGSFADAAFSTDSLARRLGLSRRYVNDLLFETGTSFAERVLELRLQKARAMLTDRRHDRLKVSEIAYACGFNEVSYFNRCFRRRFGASPTQYRGAADPRE
jgi:AraC-like DNA-binding protein